MTRIDFHSNIGDRIAYTCRLVRKARAANCLIVVLVADAAQLATLDEALWSFSDFDFLPHVAAQDRLAPHTPIILTEANTDDLPHHQMMINLSGSTPENFARFERLFEIISTDEADKLAARERYLYYKQRGYQLTHYDATNA